MEKTEFPDIASFDCPIHNWFELSYAQYLTIPRSVLQEMPNEWQKRFVQCLEELDSTLDWRPKDGCYWVKLKDGKGQFKKDRFMNYRYPTEIPKVKHGKVHL